MTTTDILADPYALELEWPYLRRAILARGGLGPSPDWPRDWYPGDLYRASGDAPDVVAAELAPWCEQWANGDDAAMLAYLRAAHAAWASAPAAERYRLEESAERKASRERGKQLRQVVKAAARPARGCRSFAELVAELKRKHGQGVDLSGLRAEYCGAYESGERVTVERDGRTYRGTVGATRGPRPRFVLLLSMDL